MFLVSAVLGIQCGMSVVFAGTKTIVRSDYDKNDYILAASTKIKVSSKSEPKEVPPVPPRIPLDSEPDMTDVLTGVEGTGLSNVRVGRDMKLPNPISYYAITGISIDEEWDRPCKMSISGRLIDPRYQSETRVLGRLTVGDCKWSLQNSFKIVDVANGTPTNFDFTKDGKQFLSSISVCNGQKKLPSQFAYTGIFWKIKGLKAQGSEVRLVDSVALKGEVSFSTPKISSFKRTNCPDVLASIYEKPGWKPWHECPTGQIATSVTAYHFEDKWLTGFSLGCQSVAARYISAPPVKDRLGY